MTDSESVWSDDILSSDNSLPDVYKYSSLQGDKSVRLLILQPGGGENAEITVELVEVNINTFGTGRGSEKTSRESSSIRRDPQGSDNDDTRGPGAENGLDGYFSASPGPSTQSDKIRRSQNTESEKRRNKTDEAPRKLLPRDISAKTAPPTNRATKNDAARIVAARKEGSLNGNIGGAFENKKRGREIPAEVPSQEKLAVPLLGSTDTLKSYEALSWAWGRSAWDKSIRIHELGGYYTFKVPRNLESALKALRKKKGRRVLWIDAICIDQSSKNEKNHQIPLMTEIYGKARRVCVWIGDSDVPSTIAFDFIKDEVIKLQDFDTLCNDQDKMLKWDAMLNLMKRPWFSRRWVVQEIALARRAVIYCGKERVLWEDFAVAVQLFVEVETATHRLSEVIKTDPNFYHVPRWFDYVSALGASLLVDATGTLFRMSRADKTRRPLLSLEYLVSSLSVFEATDPKDIIYSLLAISKDTTPISIDDKPRKQTPAMRLLNSSWADLQKKPYEVDYHKSYVDICQEFVQFAIRQQPDQTRALDIICRPWAPPPPLESDPALTWDGQTSSSLRNRRDTRRKDPEVLPSWVCGLSGAAHCMFEHADSELKMGRQNADSLVGLPSINQRNYSAAADKKVDLHRIRFKKREKYFSMYAVGFILDKVESVEVSSQNGNIPKSWFEEASGRKPLGSNIFQDERRSEEFWRTLVADRAQNGRNPPSYYARAFTLAMRKGLTSGSLNTTDHIDNGRCSVVAEFFRRVQAVIWNRSLIKTSSKNLGIVQEDVQKGDLICILYGCSVPVILRPHVKSAEEIKREREEDMEILRKDGRQLAIAKDAIARWREYVKKNKDDRKKNEEEKKNEAGKQAGERETRQDTAGKDKTVPESKELPKIKKSQPGDSKPEVSKPEDLKGLEWYRYNPDKYWCELKGECYVHGMMDGDAIQVKSAKLFESLEKGDKWLKIPNERFEIR